MKYLHLYIFVFIFQIADAQIITSSTNPTPGTINKQIGIIGFDTNEVKKTGNAQVWNFNNLTLTGLNITTSYSDVAGSPFINEFPGANIIQKTSNQPDAFFKADNSGMHFIGGVMLQNLHLSLPNTIYQCNSVITALKPLHSFILFPRN